MEVKEVEVIKKEKIYTLTESELNDLKCMCKEYGSRKTKEYIAFCYDNYIWKKNFSGVVDFINDLIDFLVGRDYIPNKYNWSLFEWLEQNRE